MIITDIKQQVESYLNQAVAKHKEGQTKTAITLYLKALEIEKLLPDWVYENIIILLAQSGQASQALNLRENALQVHPNSDKVYRAIGLAFNQKGDSEHSINCYLKSLETKKNQPDWLYSSLIEMLVESDKFQLAIQVGLEGIKVHKEAPWICYHLGEAFANLKKWEKALSYYTKAVQFQSNLPDIQGKINLAINNISQGNEKYLDITLESYIAVIKLNPQQPSWFYLNLIDALLSQNKLDLAVNEIIRASEIHPEQIDLFHGCLDQILDVTDHDLDLFLNLANKLKKNSNLEGVSIVCQKGLELYPDNIELKKLLQKIDNQKALLKKGSLKKKSLGKNGDKLAISGVPEWKKFHDKANQLQSQGDLENAIINYHKSIIRNPQYSFSYHDLADTLLKLGNFQEAMIFYQRALELNSSYFWSNNNLAIAYSKLGRWNEAINLYHKNIVSYPNLYLSHQGLKDTLLNQWASMFTQGNSLLQKKNRKIANLVFSQAIKLFKNCLYVPKFENNRELPQNPSVLLIVDDHLAQCLHYRVQQKVEQLEYAGISVEYIPLKEAKLAKNKLHFYDVVIFYRVPALPDIIEIIEYAKAINKVVFYEIDDLIFDAQEYPDPFESYGGQISQEQYRGLLRGTTLFKEAMALCDYGIASTPALAKKVEQVVAKKTCFVHRNALDSLNTEFRNLNIPKIPRDYLSIFYGTGTKAHNADFEELVAPAIAKILKQYHKVRLTIMGYLTLPEVLLPYKERIDKIDLIKDVSVYWEFLRQADINIAVLLPTTVNNCKSELKWFEAGCLGVPSVVSNTQTYLEILSDGVDALIASTSEEWYTKLELLITNTELREKIAKAAYNRAWNDYSIPAMSNNIKSIIMAAIKEEAIAGKFRPRTDKKKILIVNVFCPPQLIGGATRIVKDNIDVLNTNYSREYEISIFTTDNDNPNPYEIAEYTYGNIPVTKVSTPMVNGMDWQYQNPKIYDIFTKYLEFNQPDLIHFHCVQRLTGSVLEAAADLNIPYLVTVHDAWWISDHQFLVDDQGNECHHQQNDPLAAIHNTKDTVVSLLRKRYLRKVLEKADAVLSVSKAFADLYRINGINKAQSNRNGIMLQPRLPRQPSSSGKVRLTHIGGVSAHKGYYLFKEAVEKARLINCEVIVVSHGQTPGAIIEDFWGNTPVKFISKIPQERIYEFYSTVDVLLAPSLWPESFGLVTREAAAAGVWVVASDKGALAEDLVEGVNGNIFNTDDIDNLVGILQNIDQNPDFYLKTVSESIPVRTTEEQVRELSSIYKTILNSND